MRPFCNSLQRKPLSEQTLRHSAPSIVARINPKFELHGVRQSELCAQPKQPVHGHTHREVGQTAPIQKKSLVSKRLRKMRNQREIVDRVTQKNGYAIFDPSPKTDSEKFAFHMPSVSYLGTSGLAGGSAGFDPSGALSGLEACCFTNSKVHERPRIPAPSFRVP